MNLEKNLNEFLNAASEVWMKSSLLINSIAKDNNIKYIHILQPNQYVPGSKKYTEKQKKTELCSNKGIVKYIRDGYEHLIKDGNILKEKENFIDATMIFANTKENTYSDCVCHLNLRGNQILWEKIKEYILKELKFHAHLSD